MKKSTYKHLQNNVSYFCLLLLCITGIICFFYNIYLAVFDLVMATTLIFYIIKSSSSKEKEFTKFIEEFSTQNANMANEVLSRFPLPMLVLSVDGRILWFNNMADELFENSDLFNSSIMEIVPELKWTELLKSTDTVNMDITCNSKNFNVIGNVVKRKESDDLKENYAVLLYFCDVTESNLAKKIRNDEKIDVGIITIDNYDEVFQQIPDIESENILSKINSVISKWGQDANAIVKRLQTDRYIILFEHQYLEKFIKEKFDILDSIREIGDEAKQPITISIGIGTGSHILDNEVYARNSVEMAWGRGGDQAAIKNIDEYKFYGGNSKDYEKSTRVKTRIFAKALKEMISTSDKVIFVGHKSADYDCFNSSIGLSRAVKLLNKNAYIIVDNNNAIKSVYDEMIQIDEYKSMIISPNTAQDLVTPDTLVVVLDTHRLSMVSCPEILSKTSKIVVIDHHRRSPDCIENYSLAYMEPYSSSTCEMVTEILQYIDDNKKMTNFEARALYIGIMMDTKNFVTKTGIRTFEAASYLKRYGVNTMEVKRIFNLSLDEYIKRMDIIKKTEIWYGNIAVSVSSENFNNMRVVSSQAADEMLNISGVKAAIVIYQNGNEVMFSARSFGDINVQIIMEKLGGGGHLTVAGCQLQDITLSDARDSLKDAIKEYFEENK